ncbi:hypothetical protein [Bdellovibrio sp. KM01]|uniref:hypothetical protein n=1 Tax=Bdellovibrio sp. KM01 TaxID=2748865 RepID=UPI0015E91ADD|nr:hypothetical protein [Bdellovibrio sp. KM01]QLY25060.1 hypothetical protein HW988_16815 [Bdellovibrio sp. KM01]
MPAQNPTGSARRHSVLKLDTGLRLAMALIIPLVTSLSAQAQVVSCGQVFATTARDERAPYYDEAFERALTKSIRLFSDKEGLSANDIELLVEKVYAKEEGPLYKAKDYLTLSPRERTFKALTRQMAEKVTRDGLIAYFRENGILLDSSKLLTKLIFINRAGITNVGSAGLAVYGLTKGRLPILLPDVFSKIKTDDMNVLLLRGLESKEGREILEKYHSKQEILRGYTIFNRNYTRIALAVVIAVLWDKGDDFFKEKHDDIFNDLWVRILEELKLVKGKSA